jgi:hypothetical protein
MCHPNKTEALDPALQDHAPLPENPQESVSVGSCEQAELRTLSLSESLDEQLRILDENHGAWVDEDVIVSAMEALRTITGEQGYEPSRIQQDRMRAHGFRSTDETAIPLKHVRRYARRLI